MLCLESEAQYLCLVFCDSVSFQINICKIITLVDDIPVWSYEFIGEYQIIFFYKDPVLKEKNKKLKSLY